MVDAAWLFGNEELSDARVVLVEEEGSSGGGDATAASSDQAEPAPKRARTRTRTRTRASNAATAAAAAEGPTLPIHRAIVMSASDIFKARLGAWQEGSSGEPCRVLLHVPPGQLELGRRLVRAMYEAKPSLDDLDTEQRLQLWRLADCYDAPKVVKAAAAAAGIDVAVMADTGLAWAAVLAAYPPDDSPAAAPALCGLADDALQQLFGDLEAVWASADAAEKRCQLRELPHAALEALLGDERTRVASENTVMHTIEEWVAKHELDPGDEDVGALVTFVRVARLTPHYARTVFCESALAKATFSKDQLTLAGMLPLIDDGAHSGLSAGHNSNSDGDDDDDPCANWRLPARPRSALAYALELDWSLPLSELEACVAARVAKGKGSSDVLGPAGVVWQGWPLRLAMVCFRSASGSVTLELYLRATLPCDSDAASITFFNEAVAADGGSGIKSEPATCVFTKLSSALEWGDDELFNFGGTSADADGGGGAGPPPKDWPGVEAALRAARLVHGGGGEEAHLKLRCTVAKLA